MTIIVNTVTIISIVVITTNFGEKMETRFEMFTGLITEANRCIHKIKTEEMAEFNLKSSHVSCLYYLYVSGELTLKELVNACGEDKANVSRSINDLERKGYIKSENKICRKYLSALKLTEKGIKTGKLIAEKIDKIIEDASVGLTQENRKIFYQSLSLICENLGKICSKYGD